MATVVEVNKNGKVVHGFGRGSKLLGFPTANMDPQAFLNVFSGVERGVYLGYARIRKPDGLEGPIVDCGIHKAMISLGTNPQFETTEDTLEAFIDYKFEHDFYDYEMTLIICAYVRPQLKFTDLDALIKAIQTDVDIGNAVLDLPEYTRLMSDPLFQ